MKLKLALLAILMTASATQAAERGYAYVSNQDGGVTVINLDTMESESTIDIQAKNPRGIGVTADGKYLVTANKDDDNISVIDRASGQLIKHIPVGKNPELAFEIWDFCKISLTYKIISFKSFTFVNVKSSIDLF